MERVRGACGLGKVLKLLEAADAMGIVDVSGQVLGEIVELVRAYLMSKDLL